MVGVSSGIKKRKEDGVATLSVYRDRYDMGRMCMSSSPGPVLMNAVNHELRSCGEENRL